jgi:hypothetical protein
MKKRLLCVGLGLMAVGLLVSPVCSASSLEKTWTAELKKVNNPSAVLTDFSPILRKFDKCDANYAKYHKKWKQYRAKRDKAWANAKFLSNSVPKDLKKLHKQKGDMKKLTNDVSAFTKLFGDLDEANLYKLDMKKVANHWDKLVDRMAAAKVHKNIQKNAQKALKRYRQVEQLDKKVDNNGSKLGIANACLSQAEAAFNKAKKKARKSAWGMKRKQRKHLEKVLAEIGDEIEKGSAAAVDTK